MNTTDQPDITTPLPPEPTALLPQPQPDDEPEVQTTPVAIEIVETKLPSPSAQVPEDTWSLERDIVMTTQPPHEQMTLEPIDPDAEEYTQEPLEEPPWFPKLYICIDAMHYDETGDIRVLTVTGNTLSVNEYRPRDFTQTWLTNFKGYMKNASTNTLLSTTDACDSLHVSDTVDGAGLWDFRSAGREREYHIVAQCGRKIHVKNTMSGEVTMDPVGTTWFIVPVARIQF
jgi:hypothetical protein